MSATPATQNDGGVTGAQARPSAPHSTMSARPATENDGGCEFVPRLPRKTKVDVTKCHALPCVKFVYVGLCMFKLL